MKIEITKKNEDAIETALAAVNGKATAFAVTTFLDVMFVVSDLDQQVIDLPFREKAGAKVTYTPGGPSAKKYKFGSKSTRLTMQFAADGKRVFLVGVDEHTVWPAAQERMTVTLTAKGYDGFMQRNARRFQRAQPAAAVAA